MSLDFMLFFARIVIADQIYSELKKLSYNVLEIIFDRCYNKYITLTNLLQLENRKLNQKIITIIIN